MGCVRTRGVAAVTTRSKDIDGQGIERGDDRVGLCRRGLNGPELRAQNASYAGTAGVSLNNRGAGFVPAYRNTSTGQTVISRFADGKPSPVHVLEGLPDDWVAERAATGEVRQVSAHVVAGFVRDGVFYTREAAARMVAEDKTVGR